MSAAARTHVPSMSDAAVKARTGRDWAAWFATLDRAGAQKLAHREIAHLLAARHRVPSWWSQMVAVEYERARGLRVRHQSADGFSVAISRTLSTRLPHLYEVTARAGERRKWFPTGAFEPSAHTKDKYFRGRWKQGARVDIGFYARGRAKSQIAVQVSRLAKQGDVEPVRRSWKAALARLQSLLEE
ncbi:MAG TPA: hypothetical protein VLX08_05555 [Steroidobacteraceae bacterium]|nr:hypothetical protein [Steroidobacteraceae bacterium]